MSSMRRVSGLSKIFVSVWGTLTTLLLFLRYGCPEDREMCAVARGTFFHDDGASDHDYLHKGILLVYLVEGATHIISAAFTIDETKACLVKMAVTVHFIGVCVYSLKIAGLKTTISGAYIDHTDVEVLRYVQWSCTNLMLTALICFSVEQVDADEAHNEEALLASWKQNTIMLATGFVADLFPFPNPIHLVALTVSCYHFYLVIRFFEGIFRSARESPEAQLNAPFYQRMLLTQQVTLVQWYSFPALWFTYYCGFVPAQNDLYPYLDVTTKLVSSILFSNFDIGKIDNSQKLKSLNQDALLKTNLMEVVHLRTFEHSQKALNHAAKRGLSNVFMEMQTLEKDLEDGLSADQLQLLRERVMATCNTSMEICQSVELQRRILLKEYTPKLEALDIRVLLEDKLGYKSNPNVQLEFEVPAGMINCCEEVLIPSVINCMQNAQDHGAQDTPVRVHVSHHALPNVQPELRIELRNGAGENHKSMMALQNERGGNFLLSGNTYLDDTVRKSGSAFSTFLGADEIYNYTKAAGGSADIHFLEDVVRTRLSFPATVCAASIDELRKPPEGLVLIFADDDAIQRMAIKGLFRKGKFHSDSTVLGSTYEEVENIPAQLKELGCIHGDKQIVCIFDQNMDWNGGAQEIYGLNLIKRIVASGFDGLLCIRSGQNDPASISNYVAHGADVVLGKTGKHLQPAVVLDVIANALDSSRGKKRG